MNSAEISPLERTLINLYFDQNITHTNSTDIVFVLL